MAKLVPSGSAGSGLPLTSIVAVTVNVPSRSIATSMTSVQRQSTSPTQAMSAVTTAMPLAVSMPAAWFRRSRSVALIIFSFLAAARRAPDDGGSRMPFHEAAPNLGGRCDSGCCLASVSVIVRRERPGDEVDARAVHAAAFNRGEGEPVEAHLLDELRRCDGWLPALSWVAELDDRVVAHGVCTRGHVGEVPCVGLGPIAVIPTGQRRGVGSALMHALIGAADAGGEPLIALLGDPGYYSRFGFVPSGELGIHPPEDAWGAYFQVRPLTSWAESIAGTFRYSHPFEGLT